MLKRDAKSKLIKKFNFLGKFNFAQGKFNLLAFAGVSFILFFFFKFFSCFRELFSGGKSGTGRFCVDFPNDFLFSIPPPAVCVKDKHTFNAITSKCVRVFFDH